MLAFLDPFLDKIFGPLLYLNPLLAIIIMTFLISLIIVIIYKYTTDQNLMKDLKEEMNKFKKLTKELKNEPDKMMDVQKKAMETNMKYMMQSMKSTLFTFIPIILIFGWLSANFAYIPIMPGEEFGVAVYLKDGLKGNITVETIKSLEVVGERTKEITDGKINYLFKGEKGTYLVDFIIDGKKYSHEIQIDERKYKTPEKLFNKEDLIQKITTSNEERIVLNLFGWKLGWLGTYIILSILFSIGLRKLLKVY